MKKRYIYLFLFAIPGFIISIILSLLVFGFAAGFLWLFVFGDNPWPFASEDLISIMFVLFFLTLWLACISFGYVFGKHLEQDPQMNKSHVLLSIGVSILLIFMIVFYQFSVGNLGPKSDGIRCSEYCSEWGFPASSLPPRDSGERICTCLDNDGLEVIFIPLDGIATGEQGNGP